MTIRDVLLLGMIVILFVLWLVLMNVPTDVSPVGALFALGIAIGGPLGVVYAVCWQAFLKGDR